MHILPINNYKYNQQPNFGYRRSAVFDKTTNELIYRTSSEMFRTDFNWWSFPRFLKDKYENTPKVNIINHACSSGEETYSIALTLIKSLKEGAEKFFPIIARDIDHENINIAGSEYIPLSLSEKHLLETILDFDMQKFFAIENGYIVDEYTSKPREIIYEKKGINFVPTRELKDKIQFAQGDIFKDIEDIPNENTILFCRNVWPYFSYDEQEYLLNQLAQKFKGNNSFLALGFFDFKQKFQPDTTKKLHYENPQNRMKEFLEKYHFIETGFKYIYQQK